ncbi:MAG: hypothetical protein J3R72DRAFT_441054 [Linnemannia gamsii]|nr:MAG: hypothetical protein J3R72DRAFT_441054 [Linnemannia gamsii]
MYSSPRTRTTTSRHTIVALVSLLLLTVLSLMPWIDSVSSAPVFTCKTAFQVFRIPGTCNECFTCDEGLDTYRSYCRGIEDLC